MNSKLYNFVYSKKNKISPRCKNLFIGKWLRRNTFDKKRSNIEFYDHEWLSKKNNIKILRM